jgi:DNA-binding IclR family transcriptional regulator
MPTEANIEPGGRSADGVPGHVTRTLRTLELLAERSMPTDALAEQLGVHRKTVARMLEAMRQQDWVRQDPTDPSRYRLTVKILTVAGSVVDRMDLVQVGLRYISSLRDATGESSHLSIPADGYAVHIAEEASRQPLAVASRLGERVPLHASAVGKALAAFLPHELDLAIARGLPQLTENTITDPAELQNALALVRKKGFAVDVSEISYNTCCIAAPIFDQSGHAIAAIGVSGPASRVTRDRVEDIGRTVTDHAQSISAELGYTGRAKAAG